MPGNSFDDLRDALSSTPKVRRQLGIFKEQEGNLALVQVGDEEVRIPMIGYQPHPGSPVWVGKQDNQIVCEGSSYQFAPYGTVITSTAERVRVEVDDGPTLELPYRHGLTLSAGNRVEINPVTRVVQGRLSVVPTPIPDPDPQPAPPKSTPFRNLLVGAHSSGSSNGGAYWAGDVHSWTTTGGGWFYGNRIKSTLKGAKTITRAEVYLPRLTDRYSNPLLRLHTNRWRPSTGLPSFTTVEVPYWELASSHGWIRIPTSWARYMQNNDAGLGFQKHDGVYASWKSVTRDRMSGALRFTGTR